MSLPHELRLLTTSEGPRLARLPVRELAALRTRSVKIEPTTLKADSPNPLAAVKAELQEWCVEFEPGKTSETTLWLRGVTLRHDAARGELVVDGLRASVPLRDGKVRLTLFVDRTGLEIFAADGLVYLPLPLQPRSDDSSASVRVKGDAVRFSTLEVHTLRGIWYRPR
jgi:sucrose-6-phosphate hydrolase SacC (GH32 family)